MKLMRRLGVVTAGFLKDRVTLRKPTYTDDGRGGKVTTYTDYATVWCGTIDRDNSRNLEEGQLTLNDAHTKMFIRYKGMETLQADWQIYFQSKTYTIHSIVNAQNQYQYWEIVMYSKDL